MLEITCSGTPHEIGVKHGTEARLQIERCIHFYAQQFRKSAHLEWDRVRDLALTFEPILKQKWPAYLEEINGIAQGAGVEKVDIIAINVRTEITFGLFTDGCTALSWKPTDIGTDNDSPGSSSSFLAQNWDWMEAQKPNLIHLTIHQPAKPTIKMITEAGLIGKIGLNAAGVGVCLNAIRAHGMDPTRLPCHLGLRMVLESNSRDEAVARLEEFGIASSCHMLVADATGGVGLEWSSLGVRKLGMDSAGRILHTNHFLAKHGDGVVDTNWLEDSQFRVARMEKLCHGLSGSPSVDEISGLFTDEENYPAAICRKQEGSCESATLFNIVMDLAAKRAVVRFGRPVKPDEILNLHF